MDLHFDDDEPLPPVRKPPPRTGGLNAFPAIEYILQQTSRAVYCLARGAGVPIDADAAAAIAGWLGTSKELLVDRHGPARAPGPDGSRYEWFFRLASVQGRAIANLDELFTAAHERLRTVRRTEPAPKIPTSIDGGALDDFLISERVLADAFLLAEIQRLQRTLLSDRKRFLSMLRRRASHAASSDRKTVTQWLQEAAERLSAVQMREEHLQTRERELSSKLQWLESTHALHRRSGSQPQQPNARSADLTALLPRIRLDRDSIAVLQIELADSPAYLRFLCALQDGLKIDPNSHPSVHKHEKVKAASGRAKNWWEVRLKNSVAEAHRIYYQHLENHHIEVHIVHKSDQDRFIANL
jgi:hypothetical protein